MIRAILGLMPALLPLSGPAGAEDAAGKSCVDVQIGSSQYYDCLNRQLQKSVPPPAPSSRDAPYSATSPAPEVGTFNQSAARERMGANFGHSAFPQRPPPPVFIQPLGPRP